jgi:hypothetical protein
MREVDAGTFKQFAFSEYAAFATTAFRTLPGIAVARVTICLFDGVGDLIVQAMQISDDEIGVGGVTHDDSRLVTATIRHWFSQSRLLGM